VIELDVVFANFAREQRAFLYPRCVSVRVSGGKIAPNAALSLGWKIPFLAERERRVR
jgi:hypothetical protein